MSTEAGLLIQENADRGPKKIATYYGKAAKKMKAKLGKKVTYLYNYRSIIVDIYWCSIKFLVRSPILVFH